MYRFLKETYLKLERLIFIGPRLASIRWQYIAATKPGLPKYKKIFIFLVQIPIIGKPLNNLRIKLRGHNVEAPEEEPQITENPSFIRYEESSDFTTPVSIDYENRADSCDSFMELIVNSDRRLAFEYYRSGMYMRSMAVIDQVNTHYINEMGINESDFPGKAFVRSITNNANLNKEAIRFLQTAASMSPDFPEAHYALAVIYRDQNDIESAIEEYREAIKHPPWITRYSLDVDVHAKSYFELGEIYESQDNKGEALECYRQSLHIDGHYPDAHLSYGRLLIELGDEESSLDAANHFLHAMNYRPIIATLPRLPNSLTENK